MLAILGMIFFDYPLNLNQLSQYSEFKSDANFLFSNSIFDSDRLAASTSFESYVQSLVGPNLASAFFKQYPEKLWGIDTSEMSADWAPKRIRLCKDREPFFGGEFTAIGTTGTSRYEWLKSLSESRGANFHLDHRLVDLEYSVSSDLRVYILS